MRSGCRDPKVPRDSFLRNAEHAVMREFSQMEIAPSLLVYCVDSVRLQKALVDRPDVDESEVQAIGVIMNIESWCADQIEWDRIVVNSCDAPATEQTVGLDTHSRVSNQRFQILDDMPGRRQNPHASKRHDEAGLAMDARLTDPTAMLVHKPVDPAEAHKVFAQESDTVVAVFRAHGQSQLRSSGHYILNRPP